jgi:tetratricopeptide (TPR) repeat protein
VNRLAVFHGGANLFVLSEVMGVDRDTAKAIAVQLISLGMAEEQDYSYLRLDPALPAYLKLGQAPEDLAQLEATRAEATIQLVDFLYREQFKDSRMALNLTLLELSNLLALLDWLEGLLENSTAEMVNQAARWIEDLLSTLNRPSALAKAVQLREKAAALVLEWGRARFESERLLVERLLDTGQLQSAYEKAQALLEKAQTVSHQAYNGADYDLAIAHALLARVLFMGGQAALALDLFVESQRLFETLGEQGHRMASVSLGQQADCLRDLGRLDEAAKTYEEKIRRAEKLKDYRQVAVGKGQLATVRLLQEDYPQAITAYKEALAIFERQNEPKMVAAVWHQLGMVYHKAGEYEDAEAAYRRSLEIETQNNNRAGQGSSLNQLGQLYFYGLNRLEEAVTFYRQAVDIAIELGDLKEEGVRRNNVAKALFSLKRYEEAGSEIRRAIECKSQFGHAAEPWAAFSLLYDIEAAVRNHAAARAAWVQARDAYLAYRQQGGYAQGGGGRLIEQIITDIQQGEQDKPLQFLVQASQAEDTPGGLKALAPKILGILQGSRDKALGDDPALYYADAAEVLFLIERLGG